MLAHPMLTHSLLTLPMCLLLWSVTDEFNATAGQHGCMPANEPEDMDDAPTQLHNSDDEDL